MKRIIFYVLLLFGAGCKVIQPSGNSSEQPTAASDHMKPETSVVAVTNDADTLAIKTDSLLSAIDSFGRIISTADSISVDSLLFETDSLGQRIAKTDIPINSLTFPTDKEGQLLSSDSVPKKKGSLEATVDYSSKDSIVWTAGNLAYLFGDGNVKYQSIELKADFIQMDMDSSLVYATYSVDSLGNESGFPAFSDSQQNVESKEMKYNFKTSKGLAKRSTSQQGEGYIISDLTKKMDDGSMMMHNGMYTTCEETEHPHFYIRMTKAKVHPGKSVISGPAWLVIEDVPLFPFVLPFAWFPFTDTYSSGIIMPTYGDEINRGFYLRNGGYYFALSDYFDLRLTGEIYTKGSWGLSGQTYYRKRYKYSGNFSFSHLTTVTGEKGLDDYQKSKNFSLKLSHQQDPKANPFRTISASVDYSSSSYDRNQLNSLYSQAATKNNKGSSVSLSQKFPNSPFSLTASMYINQRSQDSSVTVSLPDMNVTMARIYPFKGKNAVGKDRWYQKISVNYNAQLRNSISTKEDLLFKSNLIKDWKNAIQHQSQVNATYRLFDVINLSPNLSYTERWYSHRIEQDRKTGRMLPSDTIYGFNRVYNYSGSISASTTLYGMFTPWKPFQKYVTAIRHRMDPSISFSAVPDFGDPKYGYWRYYMYIDGLHTLPGGTQDTIIEIYSPYNGQLFGAPGRGKSGSISFSLDNNIEAKIPDANEPSGSRKLSLIDKLSGSLSYNIAADSIKWSPLNTNMRIKLSKSYTLNLNAVFDTYLNEYNDKTNRLYQVNKTRFEYGKGLGRIGRLRSTGTSYAYTFNNDTFKKWFGGKDESSGRKKGAFDDDDLTDEAFDPDNPSEQIDIRTDMKDGRKGSMLGKKNQTTGDYDDDGYYNVTIPWSFSVNYNLSVGYNTQSINIKKKEYNYQFTHALSFNGSLQPTKNWRLNFNATYDFKMNKLSYATVNISRSMHCWTMTASALPFGPMKSYSFSIAANATMLKDLKYDQRSSPYNSSTWY